MSISFPDPGVGVIVRNDVVVYEGMVGGGSRVRVISRVRVRSSDLIPGGGGGGGGRVERGEGGGLRWRVEGGVVLRLLGHEIRRTSFVRS